MAELNTYGDLKKVIKAISLKQKGEKIGNVALGTLTSLIPGAEAAKTTFDFIKAAFGKPDTKKTNTWLDKLDIDDQMSAIVDDTVENGFLKTIAATIEKEADNKPLEQDFNMNAKMVDYLKGKYGGRFISGIKENKTMADIKPKLRVDVNHNPTKKGIKVQFVLPQTLEGDKKAEATQKLQSKLNQGLEQYNLTVSQDTDVPYSNVIGFLIPIADIKLLIKNAIGGGAAPEEAPAEEPAPEEPVSEVERMKKLAGGL